MTNKRPAAPSRDPLLCVILGPTASGKSSLAITLARRFKGEILSCDSVAVYRGFEIGAAKASAEERALVPHHMLDVAEPTRAFTAGDYARQARAAMAGIAGRGRLPFVVGGTGLYLRALLEGLFPGPQRSQELRERLRARADRRGGPYLHRVLKRLDHSAATHIHANDVPKVIRAIEVCLGARMPISELWRKRGRNPLQGYRILRIGLDPPRDLLYQRINDRARRMFDAGLVDETRSLQQQLGDQAGPLNSLGYKQATQLLRGELTLAKAVAAAQQAHRNYAKRQMTWFRREPDVHWLKGFGDDAEIVRRAEALIARMR